MLIFDGNKTIQILFLHDTDKLKDNAQNILLESAIIAICWFKDSERILVAYKKKFDIFNVLSPDRPIQKSVDCDHSNSILSPPKVFEDKIIILKNKDDQLIFFDMNRQKFISQCIFKVQEYHIIGEKLIFRAS